MIRLEKVEVLGWEAAIRGMRNPMNSWNKSDSAITVMNPGDVEFGYEPIYEYIIGPNDLSLMKRLAAAGPVHGKFLRMISVYLDITAPLYWWKEFDTYKVGTVANSCSTMHKIHAREFTLDDFSHEHLFNGNLEILEDIIRVLNRERRFYFEGQKGVPGDDWEIPPKDKRIWWQLIQLLPSSYNQKRTVMLNYEVLRNMYTYRKEHKLDEWREFCAWIETLPYSELITRKEKVPDEEDEKNHGNSLENS